MLLSDRHVDSSAVPLAAGLLCLSSGPYNLSIVSSVLFPTFVSTCFSAAHSSLDFISSISSAVYSVGGTVPFMLFLLQVFFADLVQLAGRSFSINPGLSTPYLYYGASS